MDRPTIKLIREYHMRQGDSYVRPIGIVKHPDGGSAMLVRLRDGNGMQLAVLDLLGVDALGRQYVSELRAVDAGEEQDLIKWYREEL